ncbi:MAG TPA: universal stress protein [Sandaracinaceae bacterium LLY-WYZ-13_1]|nr:universal stress protein [Sandaracinaceae bacterium LLY-WYZ-13_1]
MTVLLVPTDFSSCARKAMRMAAQIAPSLHAELLLLHVTQIPPGLVEGSEIRPMPDQDPIDVGTFVREASLAELARYAEELRELDLEVKTRVELGDPVDRILEVASEQDAAMIVMGTHGRTGLAHLIIGSVAEKVMRKARKPVLTVPGLFPEDADQDSGPSEDAEPPRP